VVVVDNLSPDAPYDITTTKTSTGGIKITYSTPGNTDISGMLVIHSTSPITATPTEGVSYSAGNTIGGTTVTCMQTGLTTYSENTCLYTSPNRSTKYYFALFTKDTAGNYSLGASITDPVIMSSPAGRVISFQEPETLNGGTSTTTGATGSGGGTGTSSSTNATTTSTTTPNQGGGGGDVGILYQGSALALQKATSFSYIFETLLHGFFLGETGTLEAKAQKMEEGICYFRLYSICIAKTVPWQR
jgi:hypothetical protein